MDNLNAISFNKYDANYIGELPNIPAPPDILTLVDESIQRTVPTPKVGPLPPPPYDHDELYHRAQDLKNLFDPTFKGQRPKVTGDDLQMKLVHPEQVQSLREMDFAVLPEEIEHERARLKTLVDAERNAIAARKEKLSAPARAAAEAEMKRISSWLTRK